MWSRLLVRLVSINAVWLLSKSLSSSSMLLNIFCQWFLKSLSCPYLNESFGFGCPLSRGFFVCHFLSRTSGGHFLCLVGGLGHSMFGFVKVYRSLLVVSLSHLFVNKYEVMVRS